MAIYSEFFPLKIVIFHSHVSLPEGNTDLKHFEMTSQLLERLAAPTSVFAIAPQLLWLTFPCLMLTHLFGSVSKPCTPGEHQNSW